MQVDAVLGAVLLPHGPEVLLHTALHLVRQDDLVGDVQVAEVVLVVDAVAVLVPHGHALALYGLDMAGLYDVSARATQAHHVLVQMRQVACPTAHPGLP